MVELRDIEIVSTIAKFGTINLAADALGLSQPALTKRLKAIEQRAGMTLFNRLSRGVELTPSGEFFLDQGAGLLIHASDFERALDLHRSGQDGYLRLGAKPGVHDIFFRECLTSFSSSHPNVRVTIDTNSTPQLCESTLSGQLDLAIVGLGYEDKTGSDPVLDENLSFEPLFELDFALVARVDHPAFAPDAGPNAILKYPLACPLPPQGMIRIWKSLAERDGVIFDGPTILMDDYEFIFQLAARSNFWTGIFTGNRTEADTKERFVRLHRPELLPPMTVGVVTRRTWSKSPAAEKIIDLLKRSEPSQRVSDGKLGHRPSSKRNRKTSVGRFFRATAVELNSHFDAN